MDRTATARTSKTTSCQTINVPGRTAQIAHLARTHFICDETTPVPPQAIHDPFTLEGQERLFQLRGQGVH